MPIISDSHKFIFIHAYKTAGTSISQCLVQYGDDAGISRHQTSYGILQALGTEKHQEYFKIMFVRNIWDWQYSLYNYIKTTENHLDHKLFSQMSFEGYVYWRCNIIEEERPPIDCEKAIDSPNLASYHSFSHCAKDKEGNLIVDFIGRFESLQHDYDQICKKIGIEAANLPMLNKLDHANYREYYNSKTINIIGDHFKDDIDWLNYDF